jgi:hypothetical protein
LSEIKSLIVFGDSFSTNTTSESWTTKIAQALKRTLIQRSQNGVSEYRILQQIQNYGSINPDDLVVVCHTNPLRIYLPDHVTYPARKTESHPFCDLVISDAWQSLKWRWLAKLYVKYFFDESERIQTCNLIRNEIDKLVPKAIHITGFESSDITSLYHIFAQNRGNINHMTPEGNNKVMKLLLEKIHADCN